MANIFNAQPLQSGTAGAGIFSNQMLNQGPVTEQQGLWNVNQARQQYSGQAETEKALRRQIAPGQSFSKTHQDMAETMGATGHGQAQAGGAAAQMQNIQANQAALQQSATAQSQALGGWNQAQANQSAGLQAPMANAMAGIGTNMFNTMGNVAAQGFQPAPQVGAANLGPNMQTAGTFNANQMSAPTTQNLTANVGKSSAGSVNVGKVGSYQGRAGKV
jgi:hypothetical protein